MVVRVRLSTTVDPEPLAAAHAVRPGSSNAVVIDEALAALAGRHRPAQVEPGPGDDEHLQIEPDQWGDLASWRRAAGQGPAGAGGTPTSEGEAAW